MWCCDAEISMCHKQNLYVGPIIYVSSLDKNMGFFGKLVIPINSINVHKASECEITTYRYHGTGTTISKYL